MIVVTYATHPSNYFDILEKSAGFHGYKLVVLGHGNLWKGLMDKFLCLADFVTTLPAEEIVVFVDAFDTIVLRPDCLETFYKIYQEGKVLFSAGHADTVMNFMFGKPHPRDEKKWYNSINTGLYMGYVRDLQCLFEKFQPYMASEENDQRAMNLYYRERSEHIQLDTECQIFYNVEWQLPTSLVYLYWIVGMPYEAPLTCSHYKCDDKKQLTVMKTQTQPYFVQGNMNVNMNHLVDYLGWNKVEKRRNHWHYYITYVSYAFHRFWNMVVRRRRTVDSQTPPSVPKDMLFKVDSRTGQFVP